MLEILANIGYVFLSINLIIFLKGFSRNGKAFKIFTIYTAVIFLIQICAEVLSKNHMPNLYLSHAYFILQFVLLSFFYLEILTEKIQKKIVLYALFICPLILALQYYNDPKLFFKFNLFEIFITSFLLILYATFYLYNLLNEKKSFYYINLGLLLYMFGSTVLFLVGNLIGSFGPKFNQMTYSLNAGLYIIYQLFILYDYKIMLKKS